MLFSTRRLSVLLVVLCCAFPAASVLAQNSIYVDLASPASSGDGSSWEQAYKSLQAGLAAATSGDQVLVASGTYQLDTSTRTSTFDVPAGVSVIGGYAGNAGADPYERTDEEDNTILKGDDGNVPPVAQVYHVVTVQEGTENVLLLGLTITGGRADGTFDDLYGGGVAQPTYGTGILKIRDCWIKDNFAAERGGGVYSLCPTEVTGCTFDGNESVDSLGTAGFGGGLFTTGLLTLARCDFLSNEATNQGGAVYSSKGLEMRTCTFNGNKAAQGGAVARPNGTVIDELWIDCEFVDNEVVPVSGMGGAVWYGGASDGDLRIESCSFTGNDAGLGGALYAHTGVSSLSLVKSEFVSNNDDITPVLADEGGAVYSMAGSTRIGSCVFESNTSGGAGGALYSWSTLELSLANCLFTDNEAKYGSTDGEGGAIYVANNILAAWNCTIADNGAGGGVHLNTPDSDIVLRNCIVWGNSKNGSTGQQDQIADASEAADVDFCCVQDATPGVAPFPYGSTNDNIDTDPQFVPGAYQLTSTAGVTSPCVDEGTPAGMPDDVLDLDDDDNTSETLPVDLQAGMRCFSLSTSAACAVDIGAYEMSCWYVDDCAEHYDSGAATGRSWADAFKYLSDALDVAQPGEIIRVAGGIYYPGHVGCDGENCTDNDDDVIPFVEADAASRVGESFEITEDVIIEGGYAGMYFSNPNERDPALHRTIMTGYPFDPYCMGGFPGCCDCVHQFVNLCGSGCGETYSPPFPHPEDWGAGWDDLGGISFEPWACYGGDGFGEYHFWICDYYDDDDDGVVEDDEIDGGLTGIVNNSQHVFTTDSNVTDATVLDGLIVLGGHAYGTADADKRGAGLYNDGGSPTIKNCIFVGNMSEDDGAAVFSTNGGDPRFEDCRFEWNTAEGKGGAVFNDYVEADAPEPAVDAGEIKFVACDFVENTASGGGGAVVSESGGGLLIANSQFAGNMVGDDSTSASGGALYVEDADEAKVAGCVFTGNKCLGSAGGQGGAVFVSDDDAAAGTYSFINNTFSGNEAYSSGGLYCSLDTADTITIANSVVWGNADSDIDSELSQLLATGAGTTVIQYNTIEDCSSDAGGFCANSADNNDGDDPLYHNDIGWDQVLGTLDDKVAPGQGSPAIDGGSDLLLPTDWCDVDGDGNTTEAWPLDLEGNLRVIDGDLSDGLPTATPDRGAFEYSGFETCWFDYDGETPVSISSRCDAPDSFGGDGGFRLNMSMTGGPAPRTYGPKHLDPMMSSSPMVSKESSYARGPNQFQERPTHNDVIDLITGHPLIQETDFELPFGGATFRHIRTYASRNQTVVHRPVDHGGNDDPLGEMWDWNGLFWMMSENPILLIDSQYEGLLGDSKTVCYLILDAHHTIPFEKTDDGLYLAPPWFDAVLEHNGVGAAAPTEFYAYLHGRSIKYTFEVHAEDLWINVCPPDDSGAPSRSSVNCPCPGGLSVHDWYTNEDSCDEIGYFYYGLPKYGLLTKIEDRYGNTTKMEYCGQKRSEPGAWDDYPQYDHNDTGDTSPNQIPLETLSGECLQDCPSKGQLRSVKLYPADGSGGCSNTAEWTIAYCHRSFYGPGHDTVNDLHSQRALHSLHVYEGDVYLDDLDDSEFTIYPDFRNEATLADYEELDADFLPDDWVIEVKYLYSELMDNCPITGEYEEAVPFYREEAGDPYPRRVSPMRLIKSIVNRRPEGATDGLSRTNLKTNMYWYGRRSDEDTFLVEDTYLRALFSDANLASIIDDYSEIENANDVLGVSPASSEDILEYADLVFEDNPADWQRSLNLRGAVHSAIGTTDCTRPITPGYGNMVDRRAGSDNGTYEISHYIVKPGVVPNATDDTVPTLPTTVANWFGGEEGVDAPRRMSFPEVYLYPHRIGAFIDLGCSGAGCARWDEPASYGNLNQVAFVTLIDKIALDDNGVEFVAKRRVIEMNVAGHVLRTRSWTGEDVNVTPTEQSGYGESAVLDDKGRMIERRSTGWGSEENTDPDTLGLIHVFEYGEDDGCYDVGPTGGPPQYVCKHAGNLETVSIKQGKGDGNTEYMLASYEYHTDRIDLLTKSVKYPWIGSTEETDAEVTTYDYTLHGAADIYDRPIAQKVTIGSPEPETAGGVALYPVYIEKYDYTGNKVATGVGHVDDPTNPSEDLSRFSVNLWEYDHLGRQTRIVVDSDTATAFTGDYDGLVHMIPKDVSLADPSASAALNLETNLEYHPLYGLTKINWPGSREEQVIYIEDPIMDTVMYRWLIRDMEPDGSGLADVHSPAELQTFVNGVPKLRTILKTGQKITYPPTEDTLPAVPYGGTAEEIEGWSIVQETEWQVDGSGRPVSATQTGADGNTVSQSVEYNAFGLLWRDLAPDGTITRNVYDERGRVTHLYRGTNDINEYWSTGIACVDGLPEGCYDSAALPDDLVLLQKRSYGLGLNNAGMLTQVRNYRTKPNNQYYRSESEYGANNEDDIGWTTDHYYDWRMREAKVVKALEAEGEDPNTLLAHTYTWYDHQDRPVITAQFAGGVPGILGPDALTAGGTTQTAIGETLIAAILDETGSELLSLTYDQYNRYGSIAEARVYDVDSTGTTPSYEATFTYYDHLGNAVETHSGGSVHRTESDAKGRQFLSWTEVRTGSGTSEVRTQISKTRTSFDKNDRAVRTVHMTRPADPPAPAAPIDPTLTDSNSICSVSYTWYDKAGRIIATIDFGSNDPNDVASSCGSLDPLDISNEEAYDALLVWDKDAEGNITGCSCSDTDAADALLTCYDYDEAGRQVLVIDSGGIAKKTEYDDFGRAILVTENALDANVSNMRFTAYLYEEDSSGNQTGHLSKIAAVDPDHFGIDKTVFNNINWEAEDGTIQVTEYRYGADVVQPTDTGTYESISKNWSWVSEVRYPKNLTGQPDGENALKFTYRSDGLVATRTDERGAMLQYTYDNQDRLSGISVTGTPKAGVDYWAHHLGYEYTAGGMLSQATVFDGTRAILSQLDFTYGAWNNLVSVSQRISDGTSLLPARDVTYDWENVTTTIGGGSATSTRNRIESIAYPIPGADKIDFAYGASGSLDDHLDRVTELSRGANKLAGYRYMGNGRVVGRALGNDVITMNSDSAACSGCSCVADWDRFGRVKNISWQDSSGEVLGYGYTYDQRGNRTAMKVRGQGEGRSWAYSYDNLNRLISATKGEFASAGGFETSPSPQTYTWDLDSLGNWSGASSASHHRFADADGDGEFDSPTDVTLATEHHDTDLANEIDKRTHSDGQNTVEVDFGYDDGGNLIFDGNHYYRYDAWNRLAAICHPGTVSVGVCGNVVGTPGAEIERFVYDALNRRVRTIQDPNGANRQVTHHYYGSEAGVLAEYDFDETASPGLEETLQRWFVHGESFPDPLVMVDLTNAGYLAQGTEEVLFYLKDALGSVGALADASGDIVERYVYDPYGRTTILRGDTKTLLPPIDREYFFDFDLDGDIDLDDETYLTNCMTDSVDPFCVFVCDIDGDEEVTLSDQSVFTTWISDPGNDYGDAPPSAWQRSARAVFDIDGNGEIDLYDFDGFERCIGKTDALCLGAFDLNGDGAINLYVEFAAFAEAFEETDKSIQLYANGSRFGNPFMWTGQRYDPATRLYHFMYRSYDPNLGRWLQEDPMGPMNAGGGIASVHEYAGRCFVLGSHAYARDEYGDGMTLFGYVRGNPIGMTDPLGQFSLNEMLVTTGIQTGLGGMIGGLVSKIAGGGFWSGFTNGAIGGFFGGLASSAFAASGAGFAVSLIGESAVDGIVSGSQAYYSHGDFRAALADALYSFRLSFITAGVLGVATAPTARSARAIDDLYSSAPCNCFVAGTWVDTPDGMLLIEEVVVGDEVLTKDQEDPDGEITVGTVTRVFTNTAPAILWVTLDTGVVIGTTPGHLVWVEDSGWTYGKDLQVGDSMVDTEGEDVVIVEIVVDETPTEVYNFEVDGTFTYYAEGVWVHNNSCLTRVNGRRPINSKYADDWFPMEKLDPKLRAKYPEGVRFDADGFPVFGPHATHDVPITLTGSYKSDIKAANAKAGLNSTPDGFTWHHHQDVGRMQLVPTDLHDAIKHTGGVAVSGFKY